jgi:hypothetical protein
MKNYISFILLLALHAISVKGQNIDKLPAYLAGSNSGTEYYISFPPCYEEESGGDNSLRVFIASAVIQEVTLEVKGKDYKQTKTTESNGVIEFRIPPFYGHPYQKSGTMFASPEQVFKEYAIHIKSAHPIVVYGVSRYQYTSDGFMAIPVSSFGTEYVIGAYPQYTGAGTSYELPSLSNIVSAYDGTEVTFTMGGTKGSRTTGGMKLGEKKTFTMQKGDVLCFANLGDAADISGSLVQSNKPIGVISGNQCANVPSGVYACDYICEMELPTYTWGKEYHITPIVGRQKAPLIRVFAKEPNTKVYRDGQLWFDLSLATREEGKSFVEKRVFDGSLTDQVNSGGSPCKVISADKPIYVMLYNPGQTDDNVSSDPFQMVISPFEQYRKEIVFATPNAKGSTLPFARQYVNLVYQTNDDGSIPDDLEFATVVNGNYTWNKISIQFGPSPGFKFLIPINGKQYSMKRLQLNGDGVFRIRANNPFSAYSYGFSSFDSYGFPTSTSLFDMQVIDTEKPTPSWIQLCDGSVKGINGSEKAIVQDNPNNNSTSSKLGLIYMDIDSSFNYDFSYNMNRTFIPGLSTSTEWSLNVLNKDAEAKARLVFLDRDGNDTIISLRYTPTKYDVNHENEELQYIKVGQTVTSNVDITNKNSTTDLVISNMVLKSGAMGFSLSDQKFPITLAPGVKKSIPISFKANSKGRFKDTIIIYSDCGITENVLNEALVGEISILTSDIDFGVQDIGRKSVQNFQIRNSGDFELKITAINGPDLSQNFRPVNWPLISLKSPLILLPNESKQFTVEFNPTEPKNYIDEIVISSNAKVSDSIAILNGVGNSSTNLLDENIQGFSYNLKQLPNSLVISFNSNFDETLNISITDLIGNRVYNKQDINPIQNSEHVIDLNEYASGIYLLSIKKGKNPRMDKMFIK